MGLRKGLLPYFNLALWMSLVEKESNLMKEVRCVTARSKPNDINMRASITEKDGKLARAPPRID